MKVAWSPKVPDSAGFYWYCNFLDDDVKVHVAEIQIYGPKKDVTMIYDNMHISKFQYADGDMWAEMEIPYPPDNFEFLGE